MFKKIYELIMKLIGKTTTTTTKPTTTTTTTTEVQVHPDHVNWWKKVNKGGDGLYKPYDYEHPTNPGSSKLWLLPAKNKSNGQPWRPSHMLSAGEYEDKECTRLIKFFCWPNGIGSLSGRAINGQNVATATDDQNPGFYHVDKIKVRQAKASKPGTTFGVYDIYSKLIFTKTIIDPNIRQE